MPASPGPHDLDALARRLLDLALADEHGRHADLLIHDGHLRQSLIALAAGARLADHNAPAAATLQVLHGAVEITADGEPPVALEAGGLVQLTKSRHGVRASRPSVFLLTTETGLDE